VTWRDVVNAAGLVIAVVIAIGHTLWLRRQFRRWKEDDD